MRDTVNPADVRGNELALGAGATRGGQVEASFGVVADRDRQTVDLVRSGGGACEPVEPVKQLGLRITLVVL